MLIAAMVMETAAGFGALAALLIAGGWIAVTLQRNRLHYKLMQTALERGMTTMPGLLPGWLVSLRQGAMILTLGLGLALAGAVLHQLADKIDSPPVAATRPAQMAPEPGLAPMNRPLPEPGDRLMGDRRGPEGNPDRLLERPLERPPERSLERRPGNDGPEARMRPAGREIRGFFNPPPPSPEFERWRRVQTQRLMGVLIMCAGGVLSLLGIVRIVFACAEKRYLQESVKQS